jgi:hypothetical protein
MDFLNVLPTKDIKHFSEWVSSAEKAAENLFWSMELIEEERRKLAS